MIVPQASAELRLALSLAQSAAESIRSHFLRVDTEFKHDGSEVTVADRAAERIIREGIASAYPQHAILGEEEGESSAHTVEQHTAEQRAAEQWIVDPIDGTTWFSLGIPKFGTLIAFLRERVPVLGVIHFPITGQTVFAERGAGCWYTMPNAEPVRIHVAQDRTLSDAFISTSGVHATDLRPQDGAPHRDLSTLIRKAGKVRFAGDCYQHALLAQGRLHAAIDTVMAPWDSAALIPCLEEAGAVLSAIDGSRCELAFAGSLVASCGERLHDEILSILNP
jgi:histidinol-phosphatase